MLESIQKGFQFKPLSKEEMQSKGILGSLYGPVADVVHSTRNGRLYNEELWEATFEDPLVTEMFDNGGLMLELDHPEDREDTCSERIAAIMPEKPKKDKDGKLCAVVDILDTPLGRIAHTLAKYGFKLGISSRGNGDVVENMDGTETVVPDSYSLKAFDLVLLPAVKEARLNLLKESLELKTDLNEALKNDIDKASDNDKVIMLEALNDLGIQHDVTAANEDGAKTKLVEQLQKSLEAKLDLESKLSTLKEQLSVSYTKEQRLNNVITEAKEKLQKSRDINVKNRSKMTELQESFSVTSEKLQEATKLNEALEAKVSILTRRMKLESSEAQQAKIKLQEQSTELASAKEELQKLKSDLSVKTNTYRSKLTNATKLIEKYKADANRMANDYITIQSKLLGVTEREIKGKLNENYTLSDINRVCQDLRSYRLNLSSLPFNISNETRVRLTESSEKPLIRDNHDDDVKDLMNSLE